MLPRLILAASGAAIALSLSLTGCQAPSAPIGASGAASARQNVAVGRVAVDAATFARMLGQRRLAGAGFREFARITQARLIIEGPDMGAVQTTIPWLTEAPAGGQPYTPPTLTLEAPAGENRVFTFQALDAFGHVLATMRGLGPVTANQTQAVTLNAATDAAARVLAALIAGPGDGDPADASGIGATLDTTDLTLALQEKVGGYLGYDAAANTFSGVNPLRFRHRELARALWTGGAAALDAAASHPTLSAAATGSVAVTLTLEGLPAAGATVTLFDLTTGTPATTNGAGVASFAQVPPGTWAVRAQHGNFVVWGTVTVHDNEAAPLTLSLGSQVVFDDALNPAWNVVIYGAGGSSVVTTDAPHAGSAALLNTPNDTWLGLRHTAGALNPGELNVAHFALKSTAADASLYIAPMNEYAGVLDLNGSPLTQPLATFRTGAVGEWRTYTVPLSAFGAIPNYHGFVFVHAGPAPAITLDAVTLGVADAPARGLFAPMTADDAFGQVLGLVADGDRVLVADRGRRTIHAVDRLGRVTPLAGADVDSPAVNGDLATARFVAPFDLARGPDGRIYVSDNQLIRQIKDGQVTPVDTPANGQMQGQFMAVDPTGGTLYAMRSNDSILRRLSADGTAYKTFTRANWDTPYSIYRLAADGLGNVYFLDATGDNMKIYRFTFDEGASTYDAELVAGSSPIGATDGPGSTASFNFSTTAMLHAASDGTLTLADAANYTVRRISSAPSRDVVTLTLPATGGFGPTYLTVADDGTIYAANQTSLRKVVMP